MKVTLADVKYAQPGWFSRGNKRMFGDVNYRLLTSKYTKQKYLVRLTSQWSDMFGRPKSYIYRINPINMETLEIEPLNDKQFKSLDSVKDYLRYI